MVRPTSHCRYIWKQADRFDPLSAGYLEGVPRTPSYRLVANLPPAYRVLPDVVDLDIPGFARHRHYHLRTFVVPKSGIETSFQHFVTTVSESCSGRFLHILRMSDGEYLFNLGFQPPSIRHGLSYPWHYFRYLLARYRPRRRLIAGGRHDGKTLYRSGQYTSLEIAQIRALYADVCQKVSKCGLLGLDLSFCSIPFQENFFPALRAWLNAHDVKLTGRNYIPFYFVYALLTGPERHKVLTGRRILVIHSATGQKQHAIKASLLREGVAEVLWHGISSDRSLYDSVPVEQFIGRIDLCVFGAGIGKPAILAQLEPLGVPCIDAGFVIEVWANPEVARSRIFTNPDPVTVEGR